MITAQEKIEGLLDMQRLIEAQRDAILRKQMECLTMARIMQTQMLIMRLQAAGRELWSN